MFLPLKQDALFLISKDIFRFSPWEKKMKKEGQKIVKFEPIKTKEFFCESQVKMLSFPFPSVVRWALKRRLSIRLHNEMKMKKKKKTSFLDNGAVKKFMSCMGQCLNESRLLLKAKKYSSELSNDASFKLYFLKFDW